MSITYQGIAVMLIAAFLQASGMNIVPDNAKITAFVEVAVAIAGACAAFYGRYRKGDITVLGMRK